MIRTFKKYLYIAIFLGLSLHSLHAFVLEDFNSTTTITNSADTGSSGSITRESGLDGNAVKFSYDLGTGSYAQFGKDYSYVSFSSESINALRFRYKSTGSDANLELKITDLDNVLLSSACDKLDLKTRLQTDNQWRTITVHFSSFTLFPDGNHIFDFNRVSKIAFGVTAISTNTANRGAGTVWIDKVELFKSASNLIDDFDDGSDTNFFGGASSVASGGGTGSRQYTTTSGRQIMEFTYDVSASGQAQYLVLELQNNDFQGYTHLAFKVRGNSGAEVVKTKLESTTGRQGGALISSYLTGGITTSFQEVQIPISTFTSIAISSIAKVTFEVSNSLGSGSGTIQIDDLAFIRAGESSDAIRTLDECDNDFSSTNWDNSTHSDASATPSTISDATVPGAKSNNRVFKLNYSFKTSNLAYPTEIPYTVIERPFYLSIAPYSALNFKFKGTGSANNIEVKFTDSDDTTWYRKFLQASNTAGEWKTANIPIDQLTFFSIGTDSELNLRKIKKVFFAISKSTGGAGVFTVDSLETPESGDFATNDASRLISSFKIINNPFSPNGDKVKDECFFVYTLGSQSKVNLKVYGLDGVERKIIFSGDQSAGEQSVSWDGTDSNSEKMDNGIYLYRLEAEGVDNRKDLLVQVIAVLK